MSKVIALLCHGCGQIVTATSLSRTPGQTNGFFYQVDWHLTLEEKACPSVGDIRTRSEGAVREDGAKWRR